MATKVEKLVSPSNNLWIEPESPASVENPPEYPYVKTMKSESGHSIQLDDTPGRERVRIHHGKSGTFIEMHPTGDEVHKVFGDGYEIIYGNKNVMVKGSCNLTVNGDCNLEVLGNFNQQVNGDYKLAVKGKIDVRGVKDITISGNDDVSISANEKFGGMLRLSAAQGLNLGSDLHILGTITCDMLVAESRVSAGLGVYAGPYGFTSGVGGLSLGFPTALAPLAVPGCINAVGTITSLVSCNAPVMNSMIDNTGILNSVIMMDVFNSFLFDFHSHPTPHGVSGIPFVPFVGV